ALLAVNFFFHAREPRPTSGSSSKVALGGLFLPREPRPISNSSSRGRDPHGRPPPAPRLGCARLRASRGACAWPPPPPRAPPPPAPASSTPPPSRPSCAA